MTLAAAAPTVLDTRRLVLRPFEAADGDALYTLYGDPAVMAIRKIGTQSRGQSDQQLAAICDNWARRGFGLWAVHDRATGRFIGECGLREHRPDGGDIELSYGLVPAAWGRGFATESAIAVVDIGFQSIGLERILGIAAASNAASKHILHRLGFRADHRSGDADAGVVRMVLTRADWADGRERS